MFPVTFLLPRSLLLPPSRPSTSVVVSCRFFVTRKTQRPPRRERGASRVRFMNFNEISSPRWKLLRISSHPTPPCSPRSFLSRSFIRRHLSPLCVHGCISHATSISFVACSMHRPVNGVHIAPPQKREADSREPPTARYRNIPAT